MGLPTSTTPHLGRPASWPSIRLRIASSLAWFAGSYSVVVSASFGFLEVSASRPFPLLFVVNGVAGALLCLTGYLLRKRHKIGAILAVVLGIASGVGLVLSGRQLSVTFVLTVVALVLVLTSLGEFRGEAAA